MAGEMAILGLKYRYVRTIETTNAENLKIEAKIESLRDRLERNAAEIGSLTTEFQTIEAGKRKKSGAKPRWSVRLLTRFIVPLRRPAGWLFMSIPRKDKSFLSA
jgi:hypothetical protein